MYCRVCGGQTRETQGVHYIDGKWLLLKADYCHKHGSFVTQASLREAVEVIPIPHGESTSAPAFTYWFT